MRGNLIYVNFEGTRYRLPDLCRLKNVNYPLVKYRLLNLNWSIEDSFFTPKIEPEQSKERRVHRRKLHKANYYLKNREHFVQKQRDRYALQKEGNWERRVDNAIEEYHVCMRRY